MTERILLSIALALALAGPASANRVVNNEDAGSSFDLTGLVAWYDMNDATDAHASFDLSPTGSPSFTGGYGVAAAAGNYWTQSSVLATFMASTGNKTLVFRFRPYGGIASGTQVIAVNSATSLYVQHRTTGIRGRTSSGTDNTNGTGSSIGNWFLVICEYDTTIGGTGGTRVTVNDGTATTTTVTQTIAGSGNPLNVGATSGAAAQNVEISHFSFWTRLLTTGEKTALYNSGNDINYADL